MTSDLGSAQAPRPSTGLLSDLRLYLWNRPPISTRIGSATPGRREEHGQHILQRLGVSVSPYEVLNVHRIAVSAPNRFAFDELQHREASEGCWPNHIAPLERMDGRVDRVRVHLFRRWATRSGFQHGLRALGLAPLFQLDKLRFQDVPSPLDVDNGRFLLYACSGGYPIGICSVYVRSSIPERGELGQCQVFFLVSFNFYGRKGWPGSRLIGAVWEAIHDRVTSNILNRFKLLCEARFFELTSGALEVSSLRAAGTIGAASPD